jgi:hypothetical protein
MIPIDAAATRFETSWNRDIRTESHAIAVRELHLVIARWHLHKQQRHKSVGNPTRTLAARPHAGRFLQTQFSFRQNHRNHSIPGLQRHALVTFILLPDDNGRSVPS